MTRLGSILLVCLALSGCRHNTASVNLGMTDLQIEQKLSSYLYIGMSPDQVKQALHEADLSSARGDWEKSVEEFEQHGHVDEGTYSLGVVVADKYIEWREFGESFGTIQFFFDNEGRLARVRMWRPEDDAIYPAQNDGGRDLVLDKNRYDKANKGDG